MFKYSVLGFLPALFFSVSANALSCFQPSDTVSSDCYDKTKAAEDCKALGYEKVTTTDDNCHYLLCPFNTDYKVCVKDNQANSDGDNNGDNENGGDNTKTCGQNEELVNGICQCKAGYVSYAQGGCIDCAGAQAKLNEKYGSIKKVILFNSYGMTSEYPPYTNFLVNSCGNISSEAYNSTEPSICTANYLCGCLSAKDSTQDEINAHNKQCPNHTVTMPTFDCSTFWKHEGGAGVMTSCDTTANFCDSLYHQCSSCLKYDVTSKNPCMD